MRRLSILCFSLLVCLPLVAQSVPAPAAPTQAVPAQPAPQNTVPDANALWTALAAGNKNFVAGNVVYDELKQERAMYRDKQLPPVTVLACADSRVPPELVFSQSIGALFVVRAAGNIADTFGLASIEFAIANGYTRLLVVLGHEDCGAVESSLVVEDPISPHLRALVERIRMSFINIPYDYHDPANVRRATEANARASAAALSAESRIIRDAVASGKVKVVPAYYSLATGEVSKIN